MKITVPVPAFKLDRYLKRKSNIHTIELIAILTVLCNPYKTEDGDHLKCYLGLIVVVVRAKCFQDLHQPRKRN